MILIEKNAEPVTLGKTRAADDPERPAAKLPYSSPVLTEYGSVAKLTQAKNGSGTDKSSQQK